MSDLWRLAGRMGHLVREIDEKAVLFRCFHCDHWFNVLGGIEADNNFRFVSKEVTWCAGSQLDLFD